MINCTAQENYNTLEWLERFSINKNLNDLIRESEGERYFLMILL